LGQVARVARLALVPLALGALGCGRVPAAPSPDLAPSPSGIPCGSVRCAPCAEQFCDTGDYGVTGTCRAHVPAVQLAFGCAGPEDCQGGVCCMTPNGAACAAAGFCLAGTVRGQPMCRDDSPCGAGSRCCPIPGAPAASPYRVCTDGVTRCP
jgi:hypothetical protein